MQWHRRVGVVSIARAISNVSEKPFETVYAAIGQNTGNFMFTEAAYRLIDAETEQIGFSFTPRVINERFDAVVVPAANWLNATADWDWLVALLEQLEIPVITIGIGLQASSTDLAEVVVSESARTFVRLLARKAPFLSVRGRFTASWLHSIGIDNVVVTGCPSLYMKLANGSLAGEPGPLVLQSTRYAATPSFAAASSINRDLFRIAAVLDADMIFQSEMEELHLLLYGRWPEPLDRARVDALLACYGLTSLPGLEAYLRRRGQVFLDLPSWSQHLARSRGLIGTRLHGAILALNSDVPAVLLAHDSRTSEIQSFAAIPTAAPSAVRSLRSQEQALGLLGGDGIDQYRLTRASNSRRFVQFLLENGLAPRQSAFIDRMP